MAFSSGRATFRGMERTDKERLFLDVLDTPPLHHTGSWGEWLHTWLEDQAAEGHTLGEIAKRMDFPTYQNALIDDPWNFLERHVDWMIDKGYVRVIRIEVVA
jgi:hypothetical protein